MHASIRTSFKNSFILLMLNVVFVLEALLILVK